MCSADGARLLCVASLSTAQCHCRTIERRTTCASRRRIEFARAFEAIGGALRNRSGPPAPTWRLAPHHGRPLIRQHLPVQPGQRAWPAARPARAPRSPRARLPRPRRAWASSRSSPPASSGARGAEAKMSASPRRVRLGRPLPPACSLSSLSAPPHSALLPALAAARRRTRSVCGAAAGAKRRPRTLTPPLPASPRALRPLLDPHPGQLPAHAPAQGACRRRRAPGCARARASHSPAKPSPATP